MSPPNDQLILSLTSPQGTFIVQRGKVPTPSKNELLVKVYSAGVNPIDWKVAKYGIFLTEKDYPAILGQEGAGEVVGYGDDVKGWAIGQKVFFQGGLGNLYRTFQQYTTVPSEIATKIDGISYDDVAVLPVAYSSATVGLYHPHSGAGLTPPWATEGEGAHRNTPLLVLGGSGSVGQMVIQLAKVSGFSPIVTTASPKHAEYLRSLGATHVIPRDKPISESISAITSTPISIVYDAVGGKEEQQAAYNLLAPGGTLITVLPDATEKGTDTQGKKVINFFGSVWPEPVRPFGRQAYDALLSYLEQGKIKGNRREILPDGLGGIADGLKRMEEGKVGGFKLIAHPQETVEA